MTTMKSLNTARHLRAQIQDSLDRVQRAYDGTAGMIKTQYAIKSGDMASADRARCDRLGTLTRLKARLEAIA